MAKMPKKLKLGPFNYTVSSDPGLLLKATDIHKDSLYGESDKNTQVILIDATGGGDRQAVTLLHEICHVALDSLELNDDVEESVVREIAVNLLHYLRTNAQLVDFLLEGPT